MIINDLACFCQNRCQNRKIKMTTKVKLYMCYNQQVTFKKDKKTFCQNIFKFETSTQNRA